MPSATRQVIERSSERLAVRSARASLWSLMGQGGQQLVGVLSFLLLSRWLSPSDYGLAAMAMAVSGVLAIAGDTGVVAALVGQPEIDEVAEATGFWVVLVGALGLAAITVAVAPLLAWYFGDARITLLGAAMGLNFLLAAPGRVSMAKLVKRLDFSAMARRSIAASLSGLAVGLTVARRGGGAWALFAQMASMFAVQAGLLVARAPYKVTTRRFSRTKAAEFISFGSGATSFLLAVIIARTGDTVLGGRFLGPSALGLLGMGTKLTVVPVQKFSGAVSAVLVPTYLEVEATRRGRAFSRALGLTAAITFPASIGIFAVAPEIVALLPARWSALTPTLRILAVGTLFEPVVWYCFAVLSAEGRSRALLRLGLLLVPVGWAGSLLGSAGGSVEWLALASVAWAATSAGGMAALIWKPLCLGQSGLARLVAPLAGSVIMAGGVRLALTLTSTAGKPVGLFFGVATGVLVYALAFATILRPELKQLVELAKGTLRFHASDGDRVA